MLVGAVRSFGCSLLRLLTTSSVTTYSATTSLGEWHLNQVLRPGTLEENMTDTQSE
jgi:hypothetical protein